MAARHFTPAQTSPSAVCARIGSPREAANSATQNTTNGALFLRRGDSIQLGTCPAVPGASGTGDTLLRLFGPNGLELASSDDACGVLSQLSFAAPIDQPGAYEIRAGCFGTGTCSAAT